MSFRISNESTRKEGLYLPMRPKEQVPIRALNSIQLLESGLHPNKNKNFNPLLRKAKLAMVQEHITAKQAT